MWTNDTKASWVNRVTEDFNNAGLETDSGRRIVVQVEQLSSGDVFPKIREGEIQPTVWSPGETSWVNDANVVWQDLTGRPLTSGPCSPIVYTTIGVAMWRPMAEAMGWPDTPIGWEEFVELAADPEGWARYGHPEWGRFKFGHTHPDSSNTGLLAMVGFAYSAAGVTEGLTPEMVRSEAIHEAFRTLEMNTYHYGTSSRSLAVTTARRGPGYLSAFTNSEIGVLATNHFQQGIMRPPWTYVFVYPKEGALWSDNPFCILDAAWVSQEQREAAQIYHDFLVGRVAQENAIDEWLRPADPSLSLRPPISMENGVDPNVTVDSVQTLESVPGDTVRAILDVFHETKKRATVAIVLDRSESMVGDKMRRAVEATDAFLEAYGQDREDEIAVYVFSDRVDLLEPSGRIGDVGESLRSKVRLIFPEGNTALYDAVCEAVGAIERREAEAIEEGDPRLYGIVLLSDGQDTNSARSQSEMFDCLPSGEAAEGVKIFTIAYGEDADRTLLERIANRTNGRYFESNPEEIQEILLDILYEQ
jgi:Ca-activated chloride channel family protein